MKKKLRKKVHEILKSYPAQDVEKCQKCFLTGRKQSDWIGCDTCWRWYHTQCVNNYNFNAFFLVQLVCNNHVHAY